LLAGHFIEQKTGRIQLNDIQHKSGAIAIVDDDAPLREALVSVLQAAGFLTNAFASAEEFLDSADRRHTACLILDVRLPGMSGIELQRRLADADNHIPIIFVTAHGDASLCDLVMKAGAAGFLNKPVRSDTLLKEIQAALENTAKGRHPG
jgi:FixJ family two-component response regulator